MKLGRFANFFPLAAIHGMLAAIGLIIIAKQVPVLLNVDPVFAKGKDPLELLAYIPTFISKSDLQVASIGLASLVLIFAWPGIRNPLLKRIPAPLLVLAGVIPLSILLDLKHHAPAYTLVKTGSLLENLSLNVDFSGIRLPEVFLKYTVMFALVGSLESLLTVKAIDLLDPSGQKSDANKDLIAIGIGNIFCGFLGGLPMISEVARSSNNLSNGARTRWANFFHGFFILCFLLLAVSVLELIPNTALAAMLVAVGYRLANPKEFRHMLAIGWEQLAIFLTTIFFTLFEDLLVGIAAGIILKLILHLLYGARWPELFRPSYKIQGLQESPIVVLERSLIFSNWLTLKKVLDSISGNGQITIDVSGVKLLDHSTRENLLHFKEDHEHNGSSVQIIGIENLVPVSSHPLASLRSKA